MEPFKNIFSRDLIAAIGAALEVRTADFDRIGFEAEAGAGLEALELKARSNQITAALERHLPQDFATASDLLVASLHPEGEGWTEGAGSDAAGLRGWAVMPLADYVARRGLADFDRSMAALGEMTRRFTAEFAVRPFILHDQSRAFRWLDAWAGSPDAHQRRLASEGSRPRLPWGIRLAPLVADPEPLVPILTRLRDDPSEVVRRSVANNLNDIAKDHPERVAALAADWLDGAPPERARLVRHALRTLVKQGHPPTLAALGYEEPAVAATLRLGASELRYGAALPIEIELAETGGRAQRLVLDYVVHHRRANGGTSPKVFKWRALDLAPGAVVRLARQHAIRPITTRRYYDGTHRVEILVNGAVIAGADFELVGTGI